MQITCFHNLSFYQTKFHLDNEKGELSFIDKINLILVIVCVGIISLIVHYSIMKFKLEVMYLNLIKPLY